MEFLKFFTKVVEVERTYTDAELLSMVAIRLGDLNTLELDNEDAEEKIYNELARVEGLQDMLRDTMVKDMRRYFAVTPGEQGDMEREVIRGAFARTSHWLAKITKSKNLT